MAEAAVLLLISGGVASGKTTLAWNAAASKRAADGTAAAIDMDELTEMTAGPDWTRVREQHRLDACGLAAALIDRLHGQDVSFIAVSGSTLSPYEWGTVLERVTVPVRPIRVQLRVSVAEAIRRAQADPTRILTRDAAFVTRLHNAIDWDATDTSDLEIDTDELSAAEVTELVMSHLASETSER